MVLNNNWSNTEKDKYQGFLLLLQDQINLASTPIYKKRFRPVKMSLALLFFIAFFKLGFGQNFSGNKRSDSSDLKRLENLIEKDKDSYKSEFLKLESRFRENDQKDKLLDLYLFQVNHLIDNANYDSALVYLRKGISLYSNPKEKQLIPIHLTFASIFHSKGNIDSLVYYQDLAKQVINEKSPFYGQFLLNQALISSNNFDHKQAIELIFEGVELFESNQDLRKLAIAYNNLAFNFERLGDLDTHIQYLRKSVALNKELGNTYHLIMNYNNLGSTHREKDLLDEAIAYYDSAFVQLEKLYSPLQMAQNLLNRANIYKRKGDAEAAEPLYLEALSICEVNSIPYGEMLCKINLGDLYRQKKQYEKSREMLASALDLSLRLKAKREEALVYEKQAWLSRDLADFSSAYHLLDKYHVLNDSLVNESVRKEANALREKYEVEKKENEILSLSKDKLFQQYIMALMGIALVLLLFVIYWWNNKHKLTKVKLAFFENLNQVKEEALKQRENDLLQQTMEKVVLMEQMKDLFTKIKQGNSQNKIKSQLKAIELKKNPWNDMVEKFKLLHPQFIEKLTTDYPQLSRNDLELCSLIKMNLSTKEIAQILRITDQSVRTRKYRILKKLNLIKETDLGSWILSMELQEK